MEDPFKLKDFFIIFSQRYGQQILKTFMIYALFRQLFWTKKQNPPTFLFLECMSAPYNEQWLHWTVGGLLTTLSVKLTNCREQLWEVSRLMQSVILHSFCILHWTWIAPANSWVLANSGWIFFSVTSPIILHTWWCKVLFCTRLSCTAALRGNFVQNYTL